MIRSSPPRPWRLAAVALAAAGAAGCFACGAPTFTVREGAALSPGPPPSLSGPRVRALHLADFGDRTRQQDAVASAVIDAHRRAPFQLAVFPGDNIYDCGADTALPGAEGCRFAEDGNTLAPGFTPPADPWFGRHEEPLAGLAGIPVYLALGNHDVSPCGAPDPVAGARLKACLEVAHASPLWTMPGRHYVVDQGPARFIVVDSNLVKRDYGGFRLEDEVTFVARAAEGCAAGRFCFLVGHHPPVTAGTHRKEATPQYVARMDQLLQAGGGRIRAWLAGHDHDLQHLRSPGGLDVLVSGNGSRGRPAERFQHVSVPGARLLFASVRWGYAVLEVAPDGWTYRFEGEGGAPLYCCAAAGDGPCEPVRCE